MAEADTVEETIPVLETTDITRDALPTEVLRLKDEGFRLVTMTCVDLDENSVDLIYTFDRNLEMVHLRMRQAKDHPAPSISNILFAAFLVENEIQDQFGISFEGLVLDFDRSLYLEEEVSFTPFCKYGVTRKPNAAAR